jgi:hypothetical protein
MPSEFGIGTARTRGPVWKNFGLTLKAKCIVFRF